MITYYLDGSIGLETQIFRDWTAQKTYMPSDIKTQINPVLLLLLRSGQYRRFLQFTNKLVLYLWENTVFEVNLFASKWSNFYNQLLLPEYYKVNVYTTWDI